LVGQARRHASTDARAPLLVPLLVLGAAVRFPVILTAADAQCGVVDVKRRSAVVWVQSTATAASAMLLDGHRSVAEFFDVAGHRVVEQRPYLQHAHDQP